MAFIEVAGASAVKLNKKYIQMLEDIKATILSIPTVALWHLGRVESKLHEMKEWFLQHKIQVYCKNPDFTLLDDTGKESAAGSLAFSMFAKERNKVNGMVVKLSLAILWMLLNTS